jgi:uncharacterized beta-barrel protein YwiB (DUF1934 family)
MATWWLPEDGFTANVTLTWRRTTPGSAPGGNASESLADRIPSVKWVVRGGAHWLTYQEPEAGRTTLVIGRNELKWLRFGDISWQHTFTLGEITESTLQVGERQLPVTMETLALKSEVEPSGGHVLLVAHMSVAEAQETLQTELTFLREDSPHVGQTPN